MFISVLQKYHETIPKLTPMVRFGTAHGFYTKTLKTSKPLESRRDGISVEKRNLTDLSPVGAGICRSRAATK